MSFLCGAPAGRPTRDEETGAYDHNIDWPGLETSELIPLSDAAAGGGGSLDEALLTQRRVLFGDVVGSQHGYSATIVVWTRALGSVAAERQASAFLEVLADVCAAHVRLVFIAPPGSAADARAYLRRFSHVAPFPAELFIDPRAQTHAAVRLRETWCGVLPGGPAPPPGAPTRALFGGSRLAELVASLRGATRPFSRAGGVAVVVPPSDDIHDTARPRCPFLHAEAHPRDHASMREVLKAAGVANARDVDFDAAWAKLAAHARRGAAPETFVERAVDLEDFDIVKPKKGRKW